MRVGYGIANLRSKASAEAGLSRVRIPINVTSLYFLASATNVGASARHGAHQEAQTLTTVTLPTEYV